MQIMKKYMRPTMQVIDMETIPVMSGSAGLSDGGTVSFTDRTSTTMDAGRNRGDAWSAYEGE